MTAITSAAASPAELAPMLQPGIKRIFHPTNLEQEALPAFHHALGLAVAASATLTLLHVGREEQLAMQDLPQVRDTLRRWGVIGNKEGSEALKAKGIGVRKVLDTGDPLQACLDHVRAHRPDLMVLHTHQRTGRTAWLGGRVAEPLAREARVPALIVPGGARGFIHPDTGRASLRRVLLPVAAAPDAAHAIALAAWLASALRADDLRLSLLTIGDEEPAAGIAAPQRPGWEWTRAQRPGDVVEGILRAAEEWQADLVVMVTQGHNGFLDALRGSTTERVLRRLHCPLLTSTA